ncbi:MAG: RHS repeat-associated core domain-containing protein [Bacteroidota bacterium]
MIELTKNGTIIAEYAYDPEGLRVVKRAKGETTHYVFEGTEPIFEKIITADKSKSYVYALGKYLARVDGVIGDPEMKKYFYHTDHIGSIRVITDQAGQVVFNADYLAFGTQFGKDTDFEELHGFTGKEYDPDIGLYYFNARWYDPDLGRFISEDPAADPNNPNLYSYCGNNSIMRVDPTGEIFWVAALIGGLIGGIDAVCNGGDFFTGFFVGAVGGAISFGYGQVFGSSILGGALAGGFTSGTMSVLMGGDFGDGFRTGFVSGGIAGWLGSKTNYTGDQFLNGVKKWFNGAFGEFVATGRYTFSAGDALALCGATDAISEALSVALDPPAIESEEPNGSGTPTLDALSGEDDPWYYYSQRDPDWANEPYTIIDDPEQTIGETACGPTSAAMVITKLTGEPVTPLMTAQFALDPNHCYRTRNDGTKGQFFTAIGKEYGLSVKETTSFYEAKRHLKNNPNSIVVASMGPGHFTGSGHYIVLNSTKGFTTHVLDPYSASKNRFWWDLTLAFEGKRYYIFTKP